MIAFDVEPNTEFQQIRMQLLLASRTPGVTDAISDSYAFAWDELVYPIFHEFSDWHKPYSDQFDVTESMMQELLVFLDGLWIKKKAIPTFYQIEDKFIGEASISAWDRYKLITAIRYARLSGRFDQRFFEAIIAPREHPTEASTVLRDFSKTEISIG